MAVDGDSTKNQLIDALRDVWTSIATLGHDLTPVEWATPSRLPGWTVQDLVSHILGTESMLAGRPQPTVEVPEADHLRNDIGKFNEAWIVERRDRPGAEVLAEFEEITSERLAALERMSPAQFDEEAWTPAGHATYGRFMQIRVFDSWMHEQDLRDAVDRPGHLTGPAVDVSMAEVETALGYAVGKRGQAPAGSSVALVVTAPERRRYDVVVSDRARVSPTPTISPTATVSTDLATFVALVGGRIDPAAALRDGRVELSGDAELSERVATHLSFVI
ncbi:MAG: maleylpyruvate isomerase family mycothiol-dependent enzyme [Acidimicrobiales bacterium]